MLETKVHRRRIRVIIGTVVLIGALSIGRLFFLQIIHGKAYAEHAEHQYVSVTDTFDRGNIYLKDKNDELIAAATIESGFRLAIVPGRLKGDEATYEAIANIIPLNKEAFLTAAEKKNDPYEEVAERVTPEQADAINKLKLPGVTLYADKWRFYPGGTLASKAIGFVSYKDNTLTGNYGLENYYNDVLSRSSEDLSVNFFAELFANVQSTLFKNTGASGDIVTSIEPNVQTELERSVAAVKEQWSSDAVGGVVMDPYTGEIIAMAQVPTFDPNSYSNVDDISVYTNPFAQNVYEMGSIIKPLIMSSAIDAGKVTPQTTYFDKGSVTVGNKTIYNFDKKGRGTATMQDVLNQSLNTGMVFVEGQMGKDVFRDYVFNHFKLGEKTGIDLPGEVNGLVGTLKGNNDVNFATAAFGQGIAITPLNIIRGYAALANGGYLVTPHLATAILKKNGDEKTLDWPKSGAILKPETVSTITTMMIHVVDDGYHRGLAHYTVAAKTGTAQIARPDGTGYYDDRNLHSLVGFFPATNPRFVVYFFNYYPKKVNYAVQTLADPFFNMVQFLANYYDITPDR
ncbi:MAG TPA: penicillin-binding protein 2 [Candidatus Paceibacterota bacterium]|nr:penicillin-binding protein 2 [Candidatus Paceibacterota bacterium]